MAHYDCSYCGDYDCDCAPSRIEGEFRTIKNDIYSKAKKEAEAYYANVVREKQDELYNKYKWKMLYELYLRTLKGKIRIKSEFTYYNRLRICGFVEGQEVTLIEL